MAVLVSKGITVPFVGKLLSDFAVGESILLNVNGTPVEFIIVHQGLPSSVYDNSCNGTWLMMKYCYTTGVWNSGGKNDYASGELHSYLNNTFFNLFDSDIQNITKQVKIPYRAGSGTSKTVSSGTNGLSTKVFVPSAYELGFTSTDHSYLCADGAKLDYFESGIETSAKAKRIAYRYENTSNKCEWWSRSPYCNSSSYAISISVSGAVQNPTTKTPYYIRPTLILPSNAVFDEDTLLFKGVK